MTHEITRSAKKMIMRHPAPAIAPSIALMIICLLVALPSWSQVTQTTTTVVQNGQTTTITKVITVSRTTPAVNYRSRGDSTKVDFQGTSLLPGATGRGEVHARSGRLDIEAHFEHLRPASMFGQEYLTYVLWAISPEGRPNNLGELLLDNGKSGLKATTNLQSFGMIVTAEPYFAVTRPSNLVVLENEVRSDTKGSPERMDAKFDLLEKGAYAITGPGAPPVTYYDRKLPLDLLEARNAVAIARASGAERYAADSFNKAQSLLAQAEAYYGARRGKGAIGTVGRNAVQTAEDARVLAIQARDQQMTANRERHLENTAQASQQAAMSAEMAKSDADRARAQAEATAAAAQQQAATAQQQASAAQQEASAAHSEAAAANAVAASAIADREALRAKLLQQLNQFLATRDTVNGLIVSMPDVLFDTGKYTLRAEAHERLAKVSGILLAYPTLKLDIGGHTDSVGSDVMNQELSEKRAMAVRDYMVSQGIPAAMTTARGFGKTQPIDSNESATGRQHNRRVELVVSGEIIGTVLVRGGVQ